MTTPHTPPAPFLRFVRDRREGNNVATVTAENIGQIAALVHAEVSYASGEPVLVVRTGGSPWYVKVGHEVGLMAGEPPRIMNMGGFNRDGDWRLITEPTPVAWTRAELSAAIAPHDEMLTGDLAAERVLRLLSTPAAERVAALLRVDA